MQEGRFLKRYKRFFADIINQDGEQVVAHVPNTGSMKGLLTPESKCRYTHVDDPKRKLKYTLQMLHTPESWVGVNTHLPNNIVYEAWKDRILPHWQKYSFAQKEVKISDKSRIDLVFCESPLEDIKKITTKNFEELKSNTKLHFVEIKNVTLTEKDQPGVALFPDSVTKRGQKHVDELTQLISQGHSAEMFYLVQREDCRSFKAADHIDPVYAEKLKKAQAKGLLISAFQCQLTQEGVFMDPDFKLPILWD